MQSGSVAALSGSICPGALMTNPFFNDPILNSCHEYGRWAFAGCIEVYQIKDEFTGKIANEIDKMIEEAVLP